MRFFISKIIKASLLSVILFSFFFQANQILIAKAASDSIVGRTAIIAGQSYDVTQSDPIVFAGKLVSIFLGLLGTIFIVLFIAAGYHWMMAGGDSAKIDKAKDEMWRAVIGLLIIVGAYAIQAYVFGRI
jgi:hypothetical protein